MNSINKHLSFQILTRFNILFIVKGYFRLDDPQKQPPGDLRFDHPMVRPLVDYCWVDKLVNNQKQNKRRLR